jgi:flagellar assembly protein FliH
MSSRARRVSLEAAVTPFVWDGAKPAPGPGTSQAAPRPGGGGSADQQTRLAALEREAFAKGYEQGERSGAEAAAQRGEAILRRLTQTVEELATLRAEMIHQTERQMVQLALAIARRIVHREISLNQDLLIAMARVALDRLGDSAQVTVKLNPEEFDATGAARVGQLGAAHVTVVSDPRVPRGGCRVESSLGTMDAGVDAQLQEIAYALLGGVEAAGTHVART